MDRDHAKRIAEAAEGARAALEAAVAELRERVSPQAAEFCEYSLTKLHVELGFRLLMPLWEEHPELRPSAPDQPKASGLGRFQIPSSELQGVLTAVTRLREVMNGLFQTIEDGAATPGESQGYRQALVMIDDAAEAAHRDLKLLEGPGDKQRREL